MSKYSKIVISYIPGDIEIEDFYDTLTTTVEKEIYEDNITSEEVNTAIVDAGKRLMFNMGYGDLAVNQNQNIGWMKYPDVKPSDYFLNKTVSVVIFDKKNRKLKTVVGTWNGSFFVDIDEVDIDEYVIYWAPLPDPPIDF